MEKKNQPFLRDLWYYALPSHQLRSGKTLAKTLLNEPILFGRDRAGKAFALRDICPHRAVPLSKGRFTGLEIECCYHGWRFDPQGRCTAIPALLEDQDTDLQRFRVRAYPVRETQGNIWIYMPSSAKGEAIPEMPAPQVPHFGDRSFQALAVMRFPCAVDHAVVGLMDPAHVPFVHRSWWWRADPTLADEVKTFDPRPRGFTMRRHRLQRNNLVYQIAGREPEVEIDFQLPGIRVEQVITQQNHICNLTTITPISEEETEVTTLFYTTIPWFGLLKPILLPLTRAFLQQDRQMLIDQQTRLKFDPALLLVKDADTQARWYFQIKAEHNRAIAEQRPFVNPVKTQVLKWRS
ncbi:phenylpropionate dioxygenase [Rubidibacter lacunae KORDI 51-2]|uniref:Phenylpropionate dioxygenase n=1 Tax=Rubidibacter lacunae KORDI 51-2 TaxID=582515 RepID=U5DGM2_9CHRO|nr:aromatic ring-hydroxylating dioxygenase subunit alpha [Rubidibacter lacunae]ERN40751.1 phenylpropionate dioxygenase [Rubidibacter lacunae KORDI 51-2]